MARFDKKWFLVHVPAGVAVVALIVFGIVQCDGREEYAEELDTAAVTVKKARDTLQKSVAQMDSLVNLNKGLLEKNIQQADSIVVLNDSIDTLNGRVVDLTNKNDSLMTANDSLVVALDDCAKSKQQKQKPASQQKPVSEKKAEVGKTVVKPVSQKNTVAKPGKVETPEVKSGDDKIAVATSGAEQVIVVSDAQPVTITLGDGSANNGNIVVGNGNTVFQTNVLPDTVVRFTNTKSTVVRCRVVATQRQYR